MRSFDEIILLRNQNTSSESPSRLGWSHCAYHLKIWNKIIVCAEDVRWVMTVKVATEFRGTQYSQKATIRAVSSLKACRHSLPPTGNSDTCSQRSSLTMGSTRKD